MYEGWPVIPECYCPAAVNMYDAKLTLASENATPTRKHVPQKPRIVTNILGNTAIFNINHISQSCVQVHCHYFANIRSERLSLIDRQEAKATASHI
jgi:hypothetical protein